MKSKTYELSLVKDYVSSWGIVQAVRELLQNQLDSKAPFQCEYVNNSLIITTQGVSLPSKSLLLGATTKANDDETIGSFGEGYKIALLVLTRLHKPVIIFNGIKIWKPEFRESEIYEGTETLHITETARYGMTNDLTFEIQSISQEEYAEIVDSCLHLWDEERIGTVYHTDRGAILKDHAGKLYVNGLFVCDTGLKYSYDIKPRYLKLERDRQTVSSWDLKYQTTSMWIDSGHYEEIAEMVEDKVADIEYANYFTTNNDLLSAVFVNFSKKHNGKTAVSNQDEFQFVSESKSSQPVIVPGLMMSLLNANPSYTKSMTMPISETPKLALERWLDEYKDDLSDDALSAFNLLIDKAEGWN